MKRFDLIEAPVAGTSTSLYSVHDSYGWYRFAYMPTEDAAVKTQEWLNEAHEDGRLLTPSDDYTSTGES